MKLIKPQEEFITSYKEAIKEDILYRPNAERIFGNPDTIIENSYKFENGIDLPKGFVKSTTLWLIDNETFIGQVNIRHELTDYLLNYGGNIGYAIRYSKSSKGYGTKILSMALKYCKNVLNLKKVLITCDDCNVASIKVIENNGGILENKVKNNLERGKVITRRYWIEL